MHRLVFALLLVPNFAVADGAIHGDKSGTFDCKKDRVVSLQTGDGTFTFTGTCEKIVVNGANNKLTIENVKKLAIVGDSNTIDIQGADKIAATGSGNTISYKGTTTGKGKTAVASVGSGNKITKK